MSGIRRDPAELIRILADILKDNPGLKKADYYEATKHLPNRPSLNTYLNHFGSWSAAVEYSTMEQSDVELITSAVKAKKQTQRFADTNRIERKSFREHARIENAVSAFNEELIKVLKKNNLSQHTKRHCSGMCDTDNAVGIIHFSDPHFNELVELSGNRYDFNVASRRCHKFIQKAKRYFSIHNINNILLAMTGDMLNSDRRLDELLNQATNRSQASFIATEIISQMILDLNDDYNVNVACVTGNESRVGQNWAWSDAVATDNYDFSIFNMLEWIFRGSDGVTFIRGQNAAEHVVKVAGKNILLLHGNTPAIQSKVEESVHKIIGKYSGKGIIIDFVIFGHKHSCRISDCFARSSSLVGANAYSDYGLQLNSRASQNVYVMYENGGWDGIKIDLQRTDGYDGYNITESIAAYNPKSASKNKAHKTIFEVTI